QALVRETELAQQPPLAATVAVLPVVVSGDSTYRPLSRGLAELITTDLAYISTLRLLERLQIGVLLDELQLGRLQRAASTTAALTAPALERAGADPVGSLSVVDALGQGATTVLPATGGVLSSGTLDVVPTPGDVVTQAGGTASGTGTTIRHLGPETAGLPSII